MTRGPGKLLQLVTHFWGDSSLTLKLENASPWHCRQHCCQATWPQEPFEATEAWRVRFICRGCEALKCYVCGDVLDLVIWDTDLWGLRQTIGGTQGSFVSPMKNIGFNSIGSGKQGLADGGEGHAPSASTKFTLAAEEMETWPSTHRAKHPNSIPNLRSTA